ncbi:uncharacterized protein CC84DRAFT_1168695 [Paraphaeosphaeria sporulosa]|uniref:L domain-like protein n=1 Tax=Paraphaeosphaeria sporulosa TaxID=1460663 RepID=A0A177BYL8_9PLEO|nr:uncharacterized protein CC84DRAFT_1168695 [Paraphaeosphaeria sporulosa]OAG00624.1 hypothetical protein CC84DRAFT_1168695 [Paraphaeosphaeria sporulosa]
MDEDPLPSLSHATRATTTPNSPFLDPRFHALKSSSPPPLFSENDSLDTADVTNYESPREKRKRAGTWWQTGPKAPKRRQFNRNFDSGVYMMSDDSQVSAPASSVLSHLGFDGTSDIRSDPPLAPWHSDNQDEGIEHSTGPSSERTAEARSVVEEQLCEALQHHLDSNATYFSFSFGLQDNELHHLRQLNQIIHLPPGDDIEVPTEGQYRSMIPEIHLNLSFNKLRYLAPTLFQLQHLTTLTLRNNCIESVPPQIKELTSLQTLDLCHNSIRELPCELLALCAMSGPGRLTRLELAGNPIYEFDDNRLSSMLLLRQMVTVEMTENYMYNASGQRRTVPDTRNYIRGHTDMDWSAFEDHHLYTPPPVHGSISNPNDFNDKLFLVCRTAASYYDRTGWLLKNSPILPTQQEPGSSYGQPSCLTHNPPATGSAPEVWFDRPSSSKVPSLATLSLLKAYKTEPDCVREEIEYCNDGIIPPQVEGVIAKAQENEMLMYKPLRSCHCCGKDYIVPRAEWIEGWYFQHQVVPIRVAVCSWACVPDVIAKRPELLRLSQYWGGGRGGLPELPSVAHGPRSPYM